MVGKQERDMLGGILDLAGVEVSEVMTHRKDMLSIDADAPPEQIFDQVVNSPYTRLPVWRGDPDSIIGVLHAKDLLARVRGDPAKLAGLDVAALATPPWFIPDTTALLHQLLAFRQRRSHLAFVVDEYGALMGLVTLEDILEEIVGEITDEKDVETVGDRAAARRLGAGQRLDHGARPQPPVRLEAAARGGDDGRRAGDPRGAHDPRGRPELRLPRLPLRGAAPPAQPDRAAQDHPAGGARGGLSRRRRRAPPSAGQAEPR